jgi:hypothetical protein
MSGNKVGLLLTDQFSLPEPRENFQFEKAPLTTDSRRCKKGGQQKNLCIVAHAPFLYAPLLYVLTYS